MKKAQSWSFDVALAAIIFIAAFITFFAIANSDYGGKFKEASQEADYLVQIATSGNFPIRITDGNEINTTRLEGIASTPYGQLKGEAGVKNDFCIYLEDEQGNVIPVNGSVGIGSSNINISGVPCG